MAVTQLNYALKAIADLSETASTISHLPASYNAYNSVCKLLHKAEKFILPNCCDLIDPDKFSARDYALLKTPYPVTVFEAPWITLDVRNIPTVHEVETSQKRIALLVESSHPDISHLRDIHGRFLKDEDGVLLIALYHLQGKWQLHLGGFFLPYNVDPSEVAEGLTGLLGERCKEYIENGFGSHEAQNIRVSPVIIMPEICDLMVQEVGIEGVLTDMLDNSRDEIMMTLQACAIINCENINSEDLPIPKKLQGNRVKRGKPPLHQYKILDIGVDFYKLPSGGASGKNQAPKMHKRRGHIRRLDEERTTWVRHTVVNAGSKGTVSKSYRIKG